MPAFLRAAEHDAAREYRRIALGGFLRAHRARIEPDPRWPVVDTHTARRVTGLRREEIAWAAGVSVDYYTKLEQGRSVRPSAAVVGSLATALQLGPLDRRYLQALTAEDPGDQHSSDVSVQAAEQTLRSIAAQIQDAVMVQVLTGDLTVRSIDTRAARILYPDRDIDDVVGTDVSLLSYLFGDPVSRTVYVDWSAKAREVVGLVHLRMAVAGPTPELLRTIEQLWLSSSAFRYLWSRFEPHDKASGMWRLRLDGQIVECDFATVKTPTSPDIALVVYHRSAPQ